MLRQSLSVVTIAVLCSGGVAGQDRPNLTGTWIHETAGGQADDAPILTITDAPPLFTVERKSDGHTETLTFSFIGASEGLKRLRAPDDGLGGPTMVQETSAFWLDGHLYTYVARLISGRTVTQNIRYTPDESLAHMTVEQDVSIHHGYERAPGQSSVVKTIYVKQ